VILLDTHVVLWLAFDQNKISRNARAAIDSARARGEGLAISDITLLELTVLAARRRVHLDISLESFLREIEERFRIFPISSAACARSLELPAGFPGDPADRIIAATALTAGLSLVTADRAIRRSRVLPTIW